MSRKKRNLVFENLEVIDAGAKGKTVAKAPDGKVVFLPNAVPGDVVDVKTFKKRKAYYEAKPLFFTNCRISALNRLVNILELVVAANGKIWGMSINYILNKKRLLII